jgi:manganese/zinc/iron transport system permease protein
VSWTSIDTWIVLTGLVVSLSCALIGNFLVVRRMSLMGDAISHAVLPGLAIAFLVGGTRNPAPMFAGAVIAGLSTAFFTEWIHRNGKVEESSAMGVVFTTLFAIGLVLIVQAADKVDLDPGCVLYGAIELSPLDTIVCFGHDLPRSLMIGLGVLLMNCVIIALFYKEFKITAFDPEMASALGIPARRMYYLLMAMVAITAVASFESVGSIMVIAMLIVPGAAAQFVAVRLGGVIRWSLLFAVLGAIGGHLSAVALPGLFGFSDTSTSGSMAVMMGLIFTLVFLFAPHRGWISRVLAQRALRHRIIREDILGLLFRWEEDNPPPAAGIGIDKLINRMSYSHAELRTAISRLQRQNLLRAGNAEAIQMSDEGRRQAATIIHDHRLWEHFLHANVKLPADHVHATSEKLEHVTDESIRRDLEQAAFGSTTDPHGKVIP